MADERKRQALPPERLREVLDQLNEVLAEAERLRDEISRQINQQHARQQQLLSTGERKKKTR
jgi:hypothetical protein